ncbi:hypothetical protein B0H12DRAFT_167240 [Mycena haematopus]|nr:hypothetical protein B0H12DRAFT_167240 [Mycena haematopus]
MHFALQISEIVHMTVSQLDPHPREFRRMALAALAKCRIFGEPSLDALWKHQGTIQTLIACMPDGLWVFEAISRIATMWLRRPFEVTA